MTNETEIWVVYSTFSRKEEALSVARALVGERLAACANIAENMLSVYRWEGHVQQEPEVALIAKTGKASVARAIARIRELHPYQLPCITAWPAGQGFAPFMQWVCEQTA